MGALEDVLKLLERWPKWRRMSEAPDRIDALEARLATLEAKPNPATPGVECELCHERTAKVAKQEEHETFGVLGIQSWTYSCSACGGTFLRDYDPSGRRGRR